MLHINICLNCSQSFSRKLTLKEIESGKGKYCSRTCSNIVNKNITKTDNFGINNYKWKGTQVSYRALHNWVTNRKGRPNNCFICPTESVSRFEWANVSGLYFRNLADYISLCAKHHRLCDGILRLSNGY